MEKTTLKHKLLPVILTAAVIILDQITKQIVVTTLPPYSAFNEEGVVRIFGDFLRFIHVRNPAVAFSLGRTLPDNWRYILFSILPLFVIAAVFVIYFRNNDFTKLQRWCICGILGGGLGNLIDRFFRPEGVVDFIDCWFPKQIIKSGRWPTFNVADSAVVVCGAIFVITFIIQIVQDGKKKKQSQKNGGKNE